MIIFWILAAGLAGLALLFVLAPLLRPASTGPADNVDQDQVNLALFEQQLAELDADLAAGKLEQSQYDSARHDLEREVLRNVATDVPRGAGGMRSNARLTALALLVSVPASALALYWTLGNQHIIPRLEASAAGQSATVASQSSPHSGGTEGLPPLDVLVSRLEERMRQTPDDADGWTMLGRTYYAMRQNDKAEAALARAFELTPKDPQVLLAYAQTIAAANGNRLDGRPAELIAEATALSPDDPTGSWLSGMLAFQRGQYNAAVVAWKKVLPQIDPSSDNAAELRRLIAEAEQRAGVPAEARMAAQTAAPAAQAPSAGDAGKAQPAAGAAVEVSVSLEPDLAKQVTPDTTVFIYAKAASGPPMPLAAKRVTVAELPLTLRLDDSMAMMPAMKLSSFPQVIVGARVSASGQPMPQPGDLEGEVGPIASSGAGPVAVLIDHVRP